MLEALEQIEAMMQLDRWDPIQGKVYQAHWNTFVISYSRPFGSNKLLDSEKSKGLSDEQRELHKKICNEYRNQHIAHTDMTNEDLNQIVFNIEYGEIYSNPLRHHPSEDEIKKCHELAKLFHDVILFGEFKKAADCFPEALYFPKGAYKLDLSKAPGNEWVKIG